MKRYLGGALSCEGHQETSTSSKHQLQHGTAIILRPHGPSIPQRHRSDSEGLTYLVFILFVSLKNFIVKSKLKIEVVDRLIVAFRMPLASPKLKSSKITNWTLHLVTCLNFAKSTYQRFALKFLC